MSFLLIRFSFLNSYFRKNYLRLKFLKSVKGRERLIMERFSLHAHDIPACNDW